MALSIAPVLLLRAERTPHRHMKAAAFEHQRATSLARAVARLAEGGAEAKLITGGQGLAPMMAMRAQYRS